MKIDWKIEKKRGNFRPSLKYKIVLEDFEKELAISMINIQSTIPKVDNSHLDYCFPECNERNKEFLPTEFHFLNTPYFKDGETCGVIRLPFREDGMYPEVAESFNRLRQQHEVLVREAYAREPIKNSEELGFTQATKQNIAGALIAKKMLGFCTG